MTPAVAIQHAQADDAALLHNLLLRAFREYDGRLDPPSGANDETVESIALRLGEGGALICNVNDLAVGCLFYAPKSDHLYVGRLSVPPEHRKRGIGDRLLRTAEHHAVTLGLPAVRLRVRLVLETLRAYYAARGYRPIGLHSHQGYTHPTFVEMEKRL
jgi:predicted N-acetyltransferase YhbS